MNAGDKLIKKQETQNGHSRPFSEILFGQFNRFCSPSHARLNSRRIHLPPCLKVRFPRPSAMNRERIDSPDDSRLDLFRNLKKSNRTRWSSFFIAEGTTLVERVFHSSWRVHAVLASEQKLRNFASRIPDGVTVYEVDRELATQLVGFKFHLGVMAAVERRPDVPLSSALPESDSGLILVGDHVIDPQNVGLLIRIGSAFGADAVVLTAGSADAFSRRVLRVSMGNGLFLPVVENAPAADVLSVLQENGYATCATVLGPDADDLSAFTFPARTAIVFGNETHGIAADAADQCRYGVD